MKHLYYFAERQYDEVANLYEKRPIPLSTSLPLTGTILPLGNNNLNATIPMDSYRYSYHFQSANSQSYDTYPSDYFASMNCFNDLNPANSYSNSLTDTLTQNYHNDDQTLQLSMAPLPINLSIKQDAILAPNLSVSRELRNLDWSGSTEQKPNPSKEVRKKPVKTIKQLSGDERELLEWSFQNDANYYLPQNCNKLAKKLGLNRLQIRRWFKNRQHKNLEYEENAAHQKSIVRKGSNLSVLSIQPLEPLAGCFISGKAMLHRPTPDYSNASSIKHLQPVQSIDKFTDEITNYNTSSLNVTAKQADRNKITNAVDFSGQKQLAQQWHINPDSRPPNNELYLTNISDDLLFNLGERDPDLLL